MQTDPQPLVAASDPVAGLPVSNERKLLAPIWHTVLLIVILLGNSYLTAIQTGKAGSASPKAKMLEYLLTMVLEFVLLLIVWFGIRLRGVKMRELVGGRWNSVEDILIDIGIAAGFWIFSLGVLAGFAYLLGLAHASEAQNAKKMIDLLGPQNWQALVMFIVLSTVAGLVEEIIFRGYLQQQFAALTGNVYIGLIISAIIFGSGHGYEGLKRMVLIAIYGSLFGLLALWRKSLRPGMMAHAWHDSISGVALYLVQKGIIPLK
jgi:membrane protease YdiL (CAAX protease family)